ncbi:hypothetical protein JCM10212_001170 [Sporobolomyces blumeae]
MTGKTTPPRFATDLTNLTPSLGASASRPVSSRPVKSTATRPSYRQTSLADSFFRSSSPLQATPPAAVTPPTSVFDPTEQLGASPSCSPCGKDATRDEGDAEMEIAGNGTDYDEAEEIEPRSLKRRRTVSTSPDHDDEGDEDEDGADRAWQGADVIARFGGVRSDSKARMESSYTPPGKQMSAFEAMRKRELGFRAGASQLSLRSHLATLVSSNEDHVARIPSIQSHRDFAPPFSLAYSHAAKAGGKQVVAAADEEGTVSFISGEKDEWYTGPTRHSFRAHANAVFDLAWSQDDRLIATASGDQTVRLHDVETKACVGVLSGHLCTVKNVAWDPYNDQMLSTASRDGSIRVWDRRVRGYAYVDPEGSAVGSVNHIKHAHGAKSKQARGGRSATRSVTAVRYLLQQDNLLASAGSADSVIKIWDLRRSHSRRVNPASYETNEDAVVTTQSSRAHGISSMQLSPDGRRLYAFSTDSQIYAFDPLNLNHPAPLRTFSPPVPSPSATSFYVRCAVSPDSRHLACGSADGSVYLWDTEGNGKDAVRVRGHEKEVSGIDWTHDGLATCSDDSLVRQWRFDSSIARRRANPASPDWCEQAENQKLVDRWSGVVSA